MICSVSFEQTPSCHFQDYNVNWPWNQNLKFSFGVKNNFAFYENDYPLKINHV
jgi:hypothetical protein